MNVTDHARDVALLRALKRLQVAAPGDRVLLGQLEQTWRTEIGLRRDDLLDAIDRGLVRGVFRHCGTLSGAALELCPLGLQALTRVDGEAESRLGGLWIRLQQVWNTCFVLYRARRRSLRRLRVVGTLRPPAPRRPRQPMPPPDPLPKAPPWQPPATAAEVPPLRAPALGSRAHPAKRR